MTGTPTMLTPATANLSRSDLYHINNVVQNTVLSYPKELIIGILRDEYSKDSFFHYVSDQWGFPKIVDHTDLPLGAGTQDDETTRIFIGEAFKQAATFYPAILVKGGSVTPSPLSISRNRYVVDYENIMLYDGYGNTRVINVPRYYDMAGAWDGGITLDVITRDILARDEIISFLLILFTDLKFDALKRAGVVIKKASAGGPSESDERQQEKIYKQQVTLDIRTEWRRLIPISSVVDQINICVDLGPITENGPQPVPGLMINESLTLVEQLASL